MKKLLLVVVSILSMAAAACAVDAGFMVPNVEATYYIDSEAKVPALGASSRFAFIGDFEARMGWYSKVTAIGLSYDLRNLNKIKWLHIQYAWPDNWNLTIGAGGGIDFTTQKVTANIMTILLQIQIGGLP